MSLIDPKDFELASEELFKRLPMFKKTNIDNKVFIGDVDGKIKEVSFQKQDVVAFNAGSDVVEVTGHGYFDFMPIVFLTDDTVGTPLEPWTKYFIRKVDDNNIKLYPTQKDSFDDTNQIDITSAGTGNHTIEIYITEPEDFDIGVLSNALEYNRRLSRNLVEQLDLTNTEDRMVLLDEIIQGYLDVKRKINEPNSTYSQRVANELLLYPRTSKPAIADGIDRFADSFQILSGTQMAMALDYTFLDSPASGNFTGQEVYPAFLGGPSGLPFHFILILDIDITSEALGQILDFINTAKAEGISYTVLFADLE